MARPRSCGETMDRFAGAHRPAYRLFEYHGAPDAERVIVMMGSGSETVPRRCRRARARGRRSVSLTVKLFRPFSVARLPRRAAIDGARDRRARSDQRARRDRRAALSGCGHRARRRWPTACAIHGSPRVIGGRYGLGSKEFTPAMAKAVFDELDRPAPKPHFTVGILDDVTRLSLAVDEGFRSSRREAVARCSSGSAPMARSAQTRTRSRLSARRPTTSRRAISSTTRRSRAR